MRRRCPSWEPATGSSPGSRASSSGEPCAQEGAKPSTTPGPDLAAGRPSTAGVQGKAGQGPGLLVSAAGQPFRCGRQPGPVAAETRAPDHELELVDDRFRRKKNISLPGRRPESTEAFEASRLVLDETFRPAGSADGDPEAARPRGCLVLDGGEASPFDSPAGGAPGDGESIGNIRSVFEQSLAARPYFAVQGARSGKTHLLAWLASIRVGRGQTRVDHAVPSRHP